MRRKFLKAICCPVLMFAFSSCAVHSGYMQSSANLAGNNFSYVKKDVEGTAKTFYIFGIGGLNKMALVNEAKKDLLKNYQLQDGQALVDLTVNWKQTFFLVY